MDNVYLDTYYGPSPHMWGLLLHVAVTGSVLVHPHVRGVYGLLKGGLVIHHQSIPTHVGFTIPNGHAGCGKTGPSPRAWGLRGIQARRHPPLRFIPTCVGFTAVTTIPVGSKTVHPHVRGVYR